MSYNEEDAISHSSAEYLESPEKARLKALQRKLEKKGIKIDVEKKNDLNALKLALLKGQVDDAKDDKTDDQTKPIAQGTKTREQQLAAATLSADTKQSTDQQVEQSKIEDKAEDTLKQNEVQSEDS